MKRFLINNKINIMILVFLTIWTANIIYSYASTFNFKQDVFYIYFYLLVHEKLQYICFLAPLIMIVIATYNFSLKLRSGYIKYEIIRSNYKTIIKNNLLSCMKKFIILPIYFLIVFIVCYFISSGFEISNPNNIPIDIKFTENMIWTMLTFFIIVSLNSIFYINLGLICCKKNRSFIVNVIFSYLCFLVIDIISEIFIGSFLIGKLLNIKGCSAVFNLIGNLVFCDIPNLYAPVIYLILLIIISFIIIKLMYRNEEEVLIASEK